jgi:plastocyanin
MSFKVRRSGVDRNSFLRRVALSAFVLSAVTGAAWRRDPVSAATQPAAAIRHASKTVVINMVLNAKGMRFDPSDIVVNSGDLLRFVNLSGGPHNVAFDAATVPVAAKMALSAAMPSQMMALMGPLISAPKGTYTMALSNVPAGKYSYYCTPHRAMGMIGSITVK